MNVRRFPMWKRAYIIMQSSCRSTKGFARFERKSSGKDSNLQKPELLRNSWAGGTTCCVYPVPPPLANRSRRTLAYLRSPPLPAQDLAGVALAIVDFPLACVAA